MHTVGISGFAVGFGLGVVSTILFAGTIRAIIIMGVLALVAAAYYRWRR